VPIYPEIPAYEEVHGMIAGIVADSAATVKHRFASWNGGSIATATSAAGNVGVATESATEGQPSSVKYSKLYILKVSGAIETGDYLKPTTGGAGIEADEGDEFNAIALDSGTNTHIVVRIEHGWVPGGVS
jgi:hypothetical protein